MIVFLLLVNDGVKINIYIYKIFNIYIIFFLDFKDFLNN